jgi:hypothetical protein
LLSSSFANDKIIFKDVIQALKMMKHSRQDYTLPTIKENYGYDLSSIIFGNEK